jgi:predicted regulator of Ras-like GTPase activity (Roadblock/LC7/MglB family)
MGVTPFTTILSELVSRVPGAYACAFVDTQGETVDYAGAIEPFDVKVAAAHMGIVLDHVDRYGKLGEVRHLVIRGATKSFVVRRLPDGYALTLLLRKRAGFAVSQRAFAACEHALAIEAGWHRSDTKPAWYPIPVDVDCRGRPTSIGEPRCRVEVLGAVAGLPPRERGFRVRTDAGAELTLVCEAKRCWYADEVLCANEQVRASCR